MTGNCSLLISILVSLGLHGAVLSAVALIVKEPEPPTSSPVKVHLTMPNQATLTHSPGLLPTTPKEPQNSNQINNPIHQSIALPVQALKINSKKKHTYSKPVSPQPRNPIHQTPYIKPQSPKPKTQSPKPKTQSPKPNPQNPKPNPQNLIPTTQNPIPTTQNPIPKTQNLIPTTQNLIPTTQNLIPTTQNLIQKPQSLIQQPENPILKTQSPIPKNHNPILKLQTSNFKPQSLHPKHHSSNTKLQTSFKTAVPTEPEPLSELNPIYPLRARRQDIEGIVLLDVNIDEQGQAVSCLPVQPRTHHLLENSAIQAVMEAIYAPGTINSQPVESVLRVSIVFRLEE